MGSKAAQALHRPSSFRVARVGKEQGVCSRRYCGGRKRNQRVLPCVARGMSSAAAASCARSHLLQRTVMRFLEDLLVRVPTGAARGRQDIQDRSQELQSQAGVPWSGVLQELVVSQHVGTQPGPGRDALTCPEGGHL